MLDFGCGIGNMTRAVANVFPRAQLVGTDLSQQSLTKAGDLTMENPRVRFAHTLSDRLPFDEPAFDVGLRAAFSITFPLRNACTGRKRCDAF